MNSLWKSLAVLCGWTALAFSLVAQTGPSDPLPVAIRVSIVSPGPQSEFAPGIPIPIRVRLDPPPLVGVSLEFFSGNQRIGGLPLNTQPLPGPGDFPVWEYVWTNAPVGRHDLMAVALGIAEFPVRSEIVPIRVQNPGIPVVGVEVTDASAVEGSVQADGTQDALSFRFRRTGDLTRELTIFLGLSGTVNPQLDFEPLPEQLTFAAGESQLDVSWIPLNDTFSEGTESLIVAIVPSPAMGPIPPYEIDSLRAAAKGAVDDGGEQTWVQVSTTRPFAVEGDRFNRGEIVFQREGDLSESLTLFFLLSGDAQRGSDYTLLLDPCDDCLKPDVEITGNEITLPAGVKEVRVGVLATFDAQLDQVEPVTESAVLQIITPPGREGIQPPYWLLSDRAEVQIVERVTPQAAEVVLTAPREGNTLAVGVVTTLQALAIDPAGSIRRVEFWAGDRRLGVSEILTRDADIPGQLRHHVFNWTPAATDLGTVTLTARAVDANQQAIQSRSVTVQVQDPFADLPVVSVRPGHTPAQETGDLKSRTASFILTRAGDDSKPLTVLTELSGTATFGTDYQWENADPNGLGLPFVGPFVPVTWEPGQKELELTLTAVTDSLPEGRESVVLRLVDPILALGFPDLLPYPGYRVGDPAEAQVEILDAGATEPFARLLSPAEGDSLLANSTVAWLGLGGHPTQGVIALELLVDGVVAGRVSYCCDLCKCAPPQPGQPLQAGGTWTTGQPGVYTLTLRALLFDGEVLTSAPVKVSVVESTPNLVITTPSPGSVFSVGDSVFIDTLGFDLNSLVSTVEFFANGQKIGDSCFLCVVFAEFPPGFPINNHILWRPTVAGEYELTAVGQFGPNRRVTSQSVQVRVDGTGPRLSLVEPTDGGAVPANQEITVLAQAVGREGGITDVGLSVDGKVVAESRLVFVRAPGADEVLDHSFRITLQPGAHTLKVHDLTDPALASRPIQVEAIANQLDSFVTRTLPPSYQAGTAFTVRLDVKPPAGVIAYVIEEMPPFALPAPGIPGVDSPFWSVTQISDGGSLDLLTGKVKFGPFFTPEPRTLTYTVVPNLAVELALFDGRASADGQSSPIGGDRILTGSLHHPADRAPADNALEADELSAFAAAWKTEHSWPGGPNPIPLDHVTRAALLWKGGERYHFDASLEPPMCWVPGASVAALGASPARMLPVAPLAGLAVRSTTPQANGSVLHTLRIQPAPGIQAFALEEILPKGAVPQEISAGGVWSAASQTLRWGPFFTEEIPVITYTLTSAALPKGRVSFDGQSLPIHSETAPPESGTRLVGIDPLADGSRQLSLEATALSSGAEFELQWSTDLQNWHSLGNFTTAPSAAFARDASAVEGVRFYRARQVQ
ncbi:MAG: hypothetical protein J0M24_04755 [Verrucomicrobia bacterium]|nr:hypothetical protein [Verrucomicrobiota bacterium]